MTGDSIAERARFRRHVHEIGMQLARQQALEMGGHQWPHRAPQPVVANTPGRRPAGVR
jgi:hypothetical protein